MRKIKSLLLHLAVRYFSNEYSELNVSKTFTLAFASAIKCNVDEFFVTFLTYQIDPNHEFDFKRLIKFGLSS